MCLAIPGKVIEINDEDGIKMGVVDYKRKKNKVCLSNLDEINIGEYVVVHAGFAISKMDEENAKETLDLFEQMKEEAAKARRDIYDNPLEEEEA